MFDVAVAAWVNIFLCKATTKTISSTASTKAPFQTVINFIQRIKLNISFCLDKGTKTHFLWNYSVWGPNPQKYIRWEHYQSYFTSVGKTYGGGIISYNP